jgi:hypothetical protein
LDFDAEMRALFARLPKLILDEVGEERAVELIEKEPERLSQVIRKPSTTRCTVAGMRSLTL